jgi:hypothetical protein
LADLFYASRRSDTNGPATPEIRSIRAIVILSILELFAMTQWFVVYRTSLGVRETRSPSAPTERRALAQARTLHMQGCEILGIKGPGDTEVSEKRLNLWIANGRDRLDLAE